MRTQSFRSKDEESRTAGLPKHEQHSIAVLAACNPFLSPSLDTAPTRQLRSSACGHQHGTSTTAAWILASTLSGRPVVRSLSLAWMSRDSKAVFFCKREDGPVLLSPLPPPRPSARTLGSRYWLIPASSGYRPLCCLGPRSTLDPALVTGTAASCTKRRTYRITPPTT